MKILALSALALLAVCAHARAADTKLPAPAIDCELVREKVAEYGKAKAVAWAISNGFSLKEISQARKCLVK